MDVLLKLSDVLSCSLDSLVHGSEKDFSEVKIENKSLAERIKLLDTLEEEDQAALIRVIDSMLTKKKILGLLITPDSDRSNLI